MVLQRSSYQYFYVHSVSAIFMYLSIQSHRIYPSNFEVLNWLGRFFVASQFPEKAIKYFEFAEKLE